MIQDYQKTLLIKHGRAPNILTILVSTIILIILFFPMERTAKIYTNFEVYMDKKKIFAMSDTTISSKANFDRLWMNKNDTVEIYDFNTKLSRLDVLLENKNALEETYDFFEQVKVDFINHNIYPLHTSVTRDFISIFDKIESYQIKYRDVLKSLERKDILKKETSKKVEYLTQIVGLKSASLTEYRLLSENNYVSKSDINSREVDFLSFKSKLDEAKFELELIKREIRHLYNYKQDVSISFNNYIQSVKNLILHAIKGLEIDISELNSEIRKMKFVATRDGLFIFQKGIIEGSNVLKGQHVADFLFRMDYGTLRFGIVNGFEIVERGAKVVYEIKNGVLKGRYHSKVIDSIIVDGVQYVTVGSDFDGDEDLLFDYLMGAEIQGEVVLFSQSIFDRILGYRI